MSYNLTVILLFLSLTASADIFENVAHGIRNNSAKEISRYFNTNVELNILNQEEVYSRQQAEQLIQDFFNKNVCRSFSFLHQGVSKDGAKFAIGRFVATNGSVLRIYMLTRQSGSSEFIQELRIEKE